MLRSITYQCLKVNKSVFRLTNHMFSDGFHSVISFYVLYSCMYAQSWLTLCDPLDCSPPGSSLRGIFQARILEWVSISFSRDSSQSRIKLMSPVSPELQAVLYLLSHQGNILVLYPNFFSYFFLC